MDRVPLNLAIMSNPINWFVIFLMIYIIGLALSLLFHKQFVPTISGSS